MGNMVPGVAVGTAPDAAHCPAPLPQALVAGVWALLGPQERAAVRVSCREVRQQADQLLDTGVLRLPAAVEASTPAAATVAAFHRKLHLNTLRVQYHARKVDWHMVHYIAQYAAATGMGLSATSCSVKVARHGRFHIAAVSLMLQALPQLTHLRLTWDREPSRSLPELLHALQRCTQLQSLTLASNTYGIVEDDALAAVSQLRHLHTLRTPWCLTAQQLHSLCSTLPNLTCLGAYGLGSGSELLGPYPLIHTLTGPPAVDEGEDSADREWRAGMFSLGLSRRALLAFPSLQAVQCCALLLVVNKDITAAQLLGQADSIQLLAGSANLCMQVVVYSVAAHVLSHLTEGCWQSLQHMSVRVHAHFMCDDEPRHLLGLSAPAMAKLAAAAPHLRNLCLRAEEWPYPVLQALLPALRRLDHLHTLWVELGCLVPIGITELLMSLATDLVRGRHGLGGGHCALRRVMIRFGSKTECNSCNQILEAQGLAVRMGVW